MTEGNLTLPQVLLMSCIPDDGIDMTSLAQQLGVDNSTMTRLVDVILKRGWVYKTKNEQDKRINLLHLSEKGEHIQEIIEKKLEHLGIQVNNAVPIEDRDEVKEILSAFHWSLSKMLLKNE